MLHACNVLVTSQKYPLGIIVAMRRRRAPMKRLRVWIVALSLIMPIALGQMAMAQDGVKVDPSLDSYKAVSGVSGNLSSVGSDTLNNLMTYWAETFSKFYPSTKIQIEGKGSSTA